MKGGWGKRGGAGVGFESQILSHDLCPFPSVLGAEFQAVL